MSYFNGWLDGYNKGDEDARLMKEKHPFDGIGFNEFFRSLARPKMYKESFKNGYNKGYEDGVRFRYNRGNNQR